MKRVKNVPTHFFLFINSHYNVIIRIFRAKTMICEYCGKYFPKIKKGCVEHINVAQKTQRHIFCSSNCKEEWCLHIQKHPTGVMLMWSVGYYNNCYFFMKKPIVIKYPPYIGAKMKFSCFAYSLAL